ncbi:HlyC/CorC family transporter [candidate division KSB1 bacterium]|nr:HlyC/CorC family transporter [candidate division KSB1 bacterium]
MDFHLMMQITSFVVLLVLSAFFSGSETAFFSLTKVNRNRLKDENSKSADRVLKLLNQPRKLLITILTGNTIVNVAAAAIAALLAADLSHQYHFSKQMGILIEVVVVTLVLLIVSEITPKVFAVKNAIWLSKLLAVPIQVLQSILMPITFVLEKFPLAVSKLIKTRTEKLLLSKDDLKMLLEVGKEKGALIEEEKKMIHSIFDFTKTTVKEIMVPRTDIVCVEKNIPFNELVHTIKTNGHTRIPVYDEKVDNILGILHAKELLPFIQNSSAEPDLKSIVRPTMFIPESKMIDELLRDFQHSKNHMAIVVDEYGGTSGLITLEDIIEEIVGEIQDEYDYEKPLYRTLEDGSILAAAKIDLDELNEDLQLELPTDTTYESLGGFILNLTGSLPKPKDEIKYKSITFVIEKVERNRIIQVRIYKVKNE